MVERMAGPYSSPLRGRMTRLLCVFIASLVAACALAGPRDFAVKVTPVFDGPTTWVSAPLIVDIENKGPDANGNLLLGDMEQVTRYPIDLPRGSRKRLTVYPHDSVYGPNTEIVLDLNVGRMTIPYQSKSSMGYGYGSLANYVAMVSDTPGELSFLRLTSRNGGGNASAYYDCYAKPEDFPERPLGLTGCTGIILGPGSDRLTDSAVEALKSYALTGGTLIFIGGTSATTLSDPRWTPILPLQNAIAKAKVGSDVLEDIAGMNMKEGYTAAVGTAIPGARVRADQGMPIVTERPLGMGRIVVLAINPFEEPFTRWPGRTRLITSLVRSVDHQRAASFVNGFQSTGNYYDDYSYRSGSQPYRSSVVNPYGAPGSSVKADPFSVVLPPASKVFWTLTAFFIVVVPVNFFVLRKLKRGELAWITSPLISLAFAGVFLNQASDLYGASLSTATNGVWIQQEGLRDSMFIGTTQMFFPSGGNYDLKLQNVDQLGIGNQMDYYGQSRQSTRYDPVDVGSIQIPSLRAANLAFEEISYRQIVPSKSLVKIERVGKAAKGTTFRVTNTSLGNLQDLSFAFKGIRAPGRSLSPGDSVDVVVPDGPARIDNQDTDALTAVTRNFQVLVVIATVDTLRPGPQLGAQVAGRSSVRLAYFSRIGLLGASP